MPPHNEDGVSGMHICMPWWLHKEQLAKKLDFPRGYHIEFGGGRTMPSAGVFDRLGSTSGARWEDIQRGGRALLRVLRQFRWARRDDCE
jgi:hypothetical protein